MRNRRFLIALLSAGLGLLVISLVFFVASFDASPFGQIELGMPRNQVHSLMGKPSTSWTASDLKPIHLTHEPKFQDQWTTSYGLIVVGFDSDGVVMAKKLNPFRLRDRTFKLLKRAFGM